ncbi:hypothetical protein CTAYLR_000362 [Chrysophaeum taylorii]|uniref:RAB6-interacting golgin n=1 Tax=Chrysophaeum taylorii TaxID=2483200 RepID=A0AAD7UFX2_9STRA|nr:hypothetical protein CTAYLR_000362 [Chrysophaeum taylorii]
MWSGDRGGVVTAAATSLEDLVKSEMEESTARAATSTNPPPPPPRKKKKDPPPKTTTTTTTTTNGVVADEKKNAVETARQETIAKEAQVRTALEEQQRRVREEAQRLATIDAELKKLSAKEQADIGILRAQLEELDRKLVWVSRDYKIKEQAYHKAKDEYEQLEARKRSMHEHLALVVLSSEKRRTEKLNDLLAKMSRHGSSSS